MLHYQCTRIWCRQLKRWQSCYQKCSTTRLADVWRSNPVGLAKFSDCLVGAMYLRTVKKTRAPPRKLYGIAMHPYMAACLNGGTLVQLDMMGYAITCKHLKQWQRLTDVLKALTAKGQSNSSFPVGSMNELKMCGVYRQLDAEGIPRSLKSLPLSYMQLISVKVLNATLHNSLFFLGF